MPDTILVNGGAGYIGAPLCRELLSQGHEVRALDSILHGQEKVAEALEADGVDLRRADIRDDDARRSALKGADAVVHLAAIVGDPACARDPEESHSVNVEGSAAVRDDAKAAGVGRMIFASTCSNYGRMDDPTIPVTEEGTLAPVSLYAEQKVGIEKSLLEQDHGDLSPTCLRFATVYGVAPRMRFDLTVNEFTRDLWAGKHLEVFGEQFWRPYVHAVDAGRGIATVLAADEKLVRNEVFNVGRSGENYRKLDLVEEIRKVVDSGEVSYVKKDEDPRDYKVSFDKIKAVLGFETNMTVPDGIAEVAARLDEQAFGDPEDPQYRN
jgi:nucleoside-diphosphate-sugar epimerase